MASTDGTMGVVPAMVAERLGLPRSPWLRGDRGRRRRGSAGTVTRQPTRVAASSRLCSALTDETTSRGTRGSRGSWRRRRSRWRAGRSPTSASSADEVGVGGRGAVDRLTARPPRKGHDRHRRRQRVPRQLAAEFLSPQQVPLETTSRLKHVEILVLVNHVGGAVRKTTLELLTIAAASANPWCLPGGRARPGSPTGGVRRGEGIAPTHPELVRVPGRAEGRAAAAGRREGAGGGADQPRARRARRSPPGCGQAGSGPDHRRR